MSIMLGKHSLLRWADRWAVFGCGWAVFWLRLGRFWICATPMFAWQYRHGPLFPRGWADRWADALVVRFASDVVLRDWAD